MKLRISLLILTLFITKFGFSQSINVSAVQIYAHQQSKKQLEADISKYVKQAKINKADIIVFPEDNVLNLVFDKPWNKEALIELSEFYGDYKDYISKLAKQNNMIIVGGTTTRVVNNKIYNTLIVGLPNGKTIEHDKIYLTPSEKKVGYNGEGNQILALDYKLDCSLKVLN